MKNILLTNKFRLQIFLFILVLGVISGFIYSKITKDNWYSKYIFEKPVKFEILSNTYKNLNKKYNIEFDDQTNLNYLAHKELSGYKIIKLIKKYPKLNQFVVTDKTISFYSEKINNIEDDLNKIIIDINKNIKQSLTESISISKSFASEKVKNDTEYFVNTKKSELNLLKSKKFKNTLNDLNKVYDEYLTNDGILGVKNETKKTSLQRRIYDAMNMLLFLNSEDFSTSAIGPEKTFEFLIDQAINTEEIRIKFVEKEYDDIIKKISEFDIIEIIALDKRFNKKPNITISILIFFILSFVIGSIFILLTSKFSIDQVRKMLPFLLNPK